MKFLQLLLLTLAFAQAAGAATLTGGYTIGGGLLGGNLIIDNASTGGGNSSASTGDLGWTAALAGFWSSNFTVMLTGLAVRIVNTAWLRL